MFGGAALRAKDEMIALLRKQVDMTCQGCDSRQKEIDFLREQVKTLEDRMMAMCDKLSHYEPLRRDGPSGDIEQPPYVDPETGKVHRYNETLAMYEEITDQEIANKVRAEAETNAAAKKVTDVDQEWHQQRQAHINDHATEWNRYVEDKTKKIQNILEEKVEGEEKTKIASPPETIGATGSE